MAINTSANYRIATEEAFATKDILDELAKIIETHSIERPLTALR